MARRMDSHWPGLARTSSALLASTALMDTSWSLPRAMPSPPPDDDDAPPDACAAASRPRAPAASGAGVSVDRICTGSRPGMMDGEALDSLRPEAPPLPPPNTWPSWSARSVAFMYSTS